MSVPTVPAGSQPVLGSANGNLFQDQNSALMWYLPALAPADPSALFAFAATIGPQVDAQGHPLDTASLTIRLLVGDPPDVTAARAANPSTQFQLIPATLCDATLLVPYQDSTNTTQTTPVSGTVSVAQDGSLSVVFAALIGPTVIQAYTALTSVGGATISIGYGYQAVTRVWRPIWHPFPVVSPIVHPGPIRPVLQSPATDGDPSEETTSPELILPTVPFPTHPVFPIQVQPVVPVSVVPTGSWSGWISTTGRAVIPAGLGLTYAGQGYRQQFTITDPPPAPTRAIVDMTDLTAFTSQRTEYEELLSLGTVSSKYPSLARVYLGQISGTVVAIPTAYGIVHGAGGCMATIDAVVDTSSASSSGSRFVFTFELAPIVDPLDMQQLAQDLTAVPEATGRVLTLSLPSGLAATVTPTFSAADMLDDFSIADGPDPHTVVVSFAIADKGAGDELVPAWVIVNEFLAQLTATGTPAALFGSLGIRLDDAYPSPPSASYFLALTTTASADDLATTVTASADPATVTVTNQSPNDLWLRRAGILADSAMTVVELNEVLVAGGSTTLPAPSTATSAVIDRGLSLPVPFARAGLPLYISVHVDDVQQLQHVMTVDASSINFAAAGLAQLTIQISLDDSPTTPVLPITLTPNHRVDNTTVVLPIGVVIVGLATTLTITVEGDTAAGNGQAQAVNDFLAAPIFTLTSEELTA